MAVHNINNVNWNNIKAGDVFMLDANVLHWLYSGYNFNDPYNKNACAQYSNFIGKLISQGVQLGTSVCNVQEALHLIEKTEFEIYKRSYGYNAAPTVNIKNFRHNPAERKKVIQKTAAEYAGIASACRIYDIQITNNGLKSYLTTMSSHEYDPLDYFVAEDCCSNNRLNFITNDRDFLKDNRLEVYIL